MGLRRPVVPMSDLRVSIAARLPKLKVPVGQAYYSILPDEAEFIAGQLVPEVLAALVSPETVEAVARAMHEDDSYDPWDDEGCNDTGGGQHQSCKEHYFERAMSAVTALRDHLGGQP